MNVQAKMDSVFENEWIRSPRVKRAYEFASMAHGSIQQLRKYTGEPYITHPLEVAAIVASVEHTEEMIIAALLHDVVEDTPVTLRQVEDEFGATVAEYVGWLTDVSKPSDGNRATRKGIDRNHTRQAPACVKTVKLGDLISNTSTIVLYDPAFAKTYLPEKALVLEVLKEGDPLLWNQAYTLLQEGLEVVKAAT